MRDKFLRIKSWTLLAVFAGLVGIATGADGQSTGTVRGRILEARTLQPLPNAQVNILGTTLGAVTSAAGEYTVTGVPTGTQRIRVRRLGFAPLERGVTVADGQTVNADFNLSSAATNLDAVVVTGTAGAVSKRTVGNAITQLDVAEITGKTAVTNVTEVLQARSPGVQIAPGSGTPGTGSEIRIRGASSFTLTPPVIYIDGIRMSSAQIGNFDPSGQGLNANSGGQTANYLDLVNPNDIESIEIIKGPAAATLYGSDAAGGVIQIITKKGARGPQSVQWTARLERGRNDLGSINLPTEYTTCDQAHVDARLADKVTPLWPGCQGVPVGTLLTGNPLGNDPAATRDGAIQRMTMGVRGSGDRYSYYVSGSHDYEEGVLHNSYDRRNSLRSNFSFTPSGKADFQVSVGVVQSRIRLPLGDESAQGLLFSSSRSSPGRISFLPGQTQQGWFTVTPAQSNQYDNQTRSNRVTLGTTLNYRPASWFRNRLTVGMDWNNGLATLFAPPNTPVLTGDTLGVTAQRVPRNTLYTLDYTGSVERNIGQSLVSTTSFGSQVVASKSETLTATGSGLGSPDVTLIGSTTTITASNNFSANNSVGYYVQQQLGWSDRLFATVAVRADDNSAFGTNFNIITYPKASLSWILSEEPRFKGLFNTLGTNNFKFRAAWGHAGKAPAPYAATRTFGIGVVTLGTSTASGLVTGSYGNPNLKAERGIETEIGFDADFFHNRGGLEFTYYNKKARDVLVFTAVAPSTGFIGSQQANLGRTANSGIELGVTGTLVESQNFSWDTRVSLSTNHNRLVSFGDTTIKYQQPFASYGSVQQHRVGYPLGGYWASFPKRNPDGTPVLVNGAVVPDTAKYIGPSLPTREVSYSNTLTLFRNFQLYGLFDYKGGNYNYRGVELYRCAFSGSCIELNDPSIPATEIPVYKAGPGRVNGVYIYKANFVKLRDLSLTYTLPGRIASMASANSAAFTIAGHNLALWSKYPGPDPEVNTYGNRSFIRGDIYAMPMTRRISATVNLTF